MLQACQTSSVLLQSGDLKQQVAKQSSQLAQQEQHIGGCTAANDVPSHQQQQISNLAPSPEDQHRTITHQDYLSVVNSTHKWCKTEVSTLKRRLCLAEAQLVATKNASKGEDFNR